MANPHPSLASISTTGCFLQLKTGVVQQECSGDMVVPTDGGLVKGQAYYARVFAYSPVGFSQGQVSCCCVCRSRQGC